MAVSWQQLLKRAVMESGGTVMFNELLARHTSFRIGGPADVLIIIKNRNGLRRLYTICQEYGLRVMILGRGTNVLISDQGVRGAVVKLEGEFSQIEAKGNRIVAGAGALLDQLVEVAESNSLTGAEFLAGIPGTVGGGVMSNAGALGKSLADIVEEIELMDPEGNVRIQKGGDLNRGYRQPLVPVKCWVLSVVVELKPGVVCSSHEIRTERWAKHPFEPSAGSFFKNPASVPAGKLIQQCGLKGMALGGAAVSDRHGNFIINRGNARFVEVYELAQIVKATVEEMAGIELEEEVRVVPDSSPAGERR